MVRLPAVYSTGYVTQDCWTAMVDTHRLNRSPSAPAGRGGRVPGGALEKAPKATVKSNQHFKSVKELSMKILLVELAGQQKGAS
jgi:hypothetical protein